MPNLFYGYSGPERPRILLVGEAWGADEEKAKLPFVGVSGQELWRMLGQAFADIRPDLHSHAADLCAPQWGLAWIPRRGEWLEAASIGMTNVLNERPPGNKLEAFCGSKAEVGKDYPYPPIVRAKYLLPKYFHHVERLWRQIDELNPNLIVAMGGTALWALTLSSGITATRGTTLMTKIPEVADALCK